MDDIAVLTMLLLLALADPHTVHGGGSATAAQVPSPTAARNQIAPSMTSPVSTVSIHPNTVYGPYTHVHVYSVGKCTYRCNLPVVHFNISNPAQRDLLDVKLKDLKKQLTVNKSELSSTKRRRECASDTRVSAKAVGLVGVVILSTCVGIIVAADLPKMPKVIHDFWKGVHGSPRPTQFRRPDKVRKQSAAILVPFIRGTGRNRISSDSSA